MLSVQRVLKDCQEKGVVKDVKKMINHPKLKPDTQNKLKFLYRADEEIEQIKTREQGQRTYDEVYNGRSNAAGIGSIGGAQGPGAPVSAEPSLQNGIDGNNSMIVDNESAYFNESNHQNGQRLYDVTMSNQDYFSPGNQVQDQEFPLQSN